MDIHKLYNKAYDWLINYGPRIIIAVLVLLAGLWFIKVLKKWVHRALARRLSESSLIPFLVSLLITALHILLGLLILQILGVQMTLFGALIAALGVAAGLALSGTLQNMTSGVIILLLRPFRVGDNIITQGQEGTVTSIEIFYTVVRTFDNRTVIVPNSKLSNEVIINTSREANRRLDIELKFSYAISLDQVRTSIESSLASTSGILKDPPHRIGVSTLEPDGYKVVVNVWINPHGFTDAKYQLQEKIMTDLKSGGVKLPGM